MSSNRLFQSINLSIFSLLACAAVLSAPSMASAASAPAGKAKGSPTEQVVVGEIPTEAVPESTGVLEAMRERLVISKIAKDREGEEVERRERVRAGLNKVIDLEAESAAMQEKMEQDLGVAQPVTQAANDEKKKAREDVRKLQTLIFNQAFLRFKSEQDGIGKAQERDLKVLSGLLCKDHPSFRKMAAYRNEMVKEYGPGQMKSAAASLCK